MRWQWEARAMKCDGVCMAQEAAWPNHEGPSRLQARCSVQSSILITSALSRPRPFSQQYPAGPQTDDWQSLLTMLTTSWHFLSWSSLRLQNSCPLPLSRAPSTAPDHSRLAGQRCRPMDGRVVGRKRRRHSAESLACRCRAKETALTQEHQLRIDVSAEIHALVGQAVLA